jgi:hypothetical protein
VQIDVAPSRIDDYFISGSDTAVDIPQADNSRYSEAARNDRRM